MHLSPIFVAPRNGTPSFRNPGKEPPLSIVIDQTNTGMATSNVWRPKQPHAHCKDFGQHAKIKRILFKPKRTLNNKHVSDSRLLITASSPHKPTAAVWFMSSMSTPWSKHQSLRTDQMGSSSSKDVHSSIDEFSTCSWSSSYWYSNIILRFIRCRFQFCCMRFIYTRFDL